MLIFIMIYKSFKNNSILVMNEQKFHVGIKALVLNDKKEVLLLKANPAELKSGIAHWDLPGGRMKEGDSVEDTLMKELEEELDLGTKNIEVLRKIDASISNIRIPDENETYGLILFVYLCKFKGKKKFRLSKEHTEFSWVPLKEAKKLLSFKFSQGFIDELDKLDKS